MVRSDPQKPPQGFGSCVGGVNVVVVPPLASVYCLCYISSLALRCASLVKHCDFTKIEKVVHAICEESGEPRNGNR